MSETVICAAVHFDDGKEYVCQKIYGINTGFVVCAFRHPYISDLLFLNPKFKKNNPDKECAFNLVCNDYKVTQGFITSLGRFVDRKEAYKIALKAKQIESNAGVDGQLFSEDLYLEQKYNYRGEEIN